MKKIVTALFIGAAAGVIDIIPMIIQQLNIYAISSAFVHWLVLGLVIPFVNWEIRAWAKGTIISVLSSLPIIIIIAEKEPVSIIPVMIMSIILGGLVGALGKKLVK